MGPEVPCADSFDLVAHIFRDVPVKFQELSLSSSSFAYPFAFQNEGLPCSVPQTSNPRAVAAETTRGQKFVYPIEKLSRVVATDIFLARALPPPMPSRIRSC